MRNRIHLLTLIAAAVAPAAFAAPAASQDGDARWLPFVGCWEAVGAENQDDAAANGLVCFAMDGDGVRLTNFVDGEAVSSELLVADGRSQPVSVEGCEGTESVRFSEDGRRVFTATDFTCGTEAGRTGTGVMSFVSRTHWVDVRSLESGDEPVSWFQEYRLASTDRLAEEGVDDPAEGLGIAVRGARASAAADLDLDDVIEASATLDATAVEAWLVLRGDDFSPSAEELVRLADAGVPDEIIDAVVAVSHPERFVAYADAPPEEYDAPVRRSYRGWMAYDPFWGPRWGLATGWGWGWGYRYGYAPGWGYPWYGAGWGYRPGGCCWSGPIVVEPRQGGRIYRGQGYAPSRSSSGAAASGSRRAVPRAGGARPSYSRGGSSGVQRSAPSSGGRQSTGRRAVRRPSGGR